MAGMTDKRGPLTDEELEQLERYSRDEPFEENLIRRLIAEVRHLRGQVELPAGGATEILDQLHDSEINGGLKWFFDGGCQWYLGDSIDHPATVEVGGASRELYGVEPTAAAAIAELAKAAAKHYPGSKFAKWLLR